MTMVTTDPDNLGDSVATWGQNLAARCRGAVSVVARGGKSCVGFLMASWTALGPRRAGLTLGMSLALLVVLIVCGFLGLQVLPCESSSFSVEPWLDQGRHLLRDMGESAREQAQGLPTKAEEVQKTIQDKARMVWDAIQDSGQAWWTVGPQLDHQVQSGLGFSLLAVAIFGAVLGLFFVLRQLFSGLGQHCRQSGPAPPARRCLDEILERRQAQKQD